MDIQNPYNEKAIAYFLRIGKGKEAVTIPKAEVPLAYMYAGSHPDIVELVWDQLGAVMSPEAQCLFCGTPALVHPQTGVALVLAIGTQYVLRVPPALVAEAIQSGSRIQNKWSSGEVTDARRELGEDWLFGGWSANELEWCKRAFEYYGRPAM